LDIVACMTGRFDVQDPRPLHQKLLPQG